MHSVKVVASFPHDAGAFTQGLVVHGGEFYESTGLNGESSLRRVEIATGRVLQEVKVPEQYFAEGLALVGDELLQLTWQHHVGFVYDRQTFKQKRTFSYKTEGWGIAYDGSSQLVMSDGSDTLSFLDPKTLAVTKTLKVRDAATPVGNLNELEWIDGEIWANVWTTDRIARISPRTGQVSSWVNLESVWPREPADAAGGRVERDRVRQGHAPDLRDRQEVAARVSDRRRTVGQVTGTFVRRRRQAVRVSASTRSHP